MVELNSSAHKAYEILTGAGGKVYVVGGAVRDSLMDIEPKDIDLLVTGLEFDDVLAHLPKSKVTGDHFGVCRWRYVSGDEVEIALPRTEKSTGPGHKDFEVNVHPFISLDDDLRRRDFTVNSMAWDIANEQLIDLFGGQQDIVKHEIKAMSAVTFEDDPLRIIRAFVLIARYGFWIEDFTAGLLEHAVDNLDDLPAERIQMELDKIFEAPHPSKAIHDMHHTGVLAHVFPELDKHWLYDQNNPHHQQILGEHQLSTLKIVEEESFDPDLRLAALLHDIGKPASAWVDPQTASNHFYQKRFSRTEWIEAGGQVFPKDARWLEDSDRFDIGYNHEDIGSEMVFDRLTALKYPSNRIVRVSRLVAFHMWNPFTTEKGARKFLNKYGELADDLLTLRYGDNGGKSGYHYQTPDITLDRQQELLDLVREKGEATSTADLAVNGHDLIEADVLGPGPEMGATLAYLTELVLDDPELNEKDELVRIARRYVETELAKEVV